MFLCVFGVVATHPKCHAEDSVYRFLTSALAGLCVLLAIGCAPSLGDNEDCSDDDSSPDEIEDDDSVADDDSNEEEPTPEPPTPEPEPLVGEVLFSVPNGDQQESGIVNVAPGCCEEYCGTWTFGVDGATSTELRGWWPQFYVHYNPEEWYTPWSPGAIGGVTAAANMTACVIKDADKNVIAGPVFVNLDGTVPFETPIAGVDRIEANVYCQVTNTWPNGGDMDGFALMFDGPAMYVDLWANGTPVEVETVSFNGTVLNPTRQIRVVPEPLLGVTLNANYNLDDQELFGEGVLGGHGFSFTGGHMARINQMRIASSSLAPTGAWDSCGSVTYGGGVNIWRLGPDGYEPVSWSGSYVSASGQPCWSDINGTFSYVDVTFEDEQLNLGVTDYVITLSSTMTPAAGDGLALGIQGGNWFTWTDLDTGLTHFGGDGSVSGLNIWGNWLTFYED